MRYTLFLLFLLVSNSITAQNTSIPDPEFEYWLIYMGYDSGNIDGKVLTSNINTIKEIYFFPGAANINIKDLTGIEDFKALEKLNCINCNLTSLDLSKNINLTELICENNKLTSLKVEGCTNLKTINCNGNPVINLDFTKTVNLETLYCRGLSLTVLDLNANLKYLDCSFCPIKNLDLTKCNLLETLICTNNQFTSLDISKNINLISLTCDNNQLTNLDISKNINLKGFTCENNQLSNLETYTNTNLTYIYCGFNKIINLDTSNNPKLLYLNCNNNLLSNLDVSKNIIITDIRCNNNQLMNLDISKNYNLNLLFCYENQLTSLNTSSNLQLNILYCNNNQITSLDVTRNTNLGVFWCHSNQLTSLDLRNPNSWNWWGYVWSWNNNPNLKCINVYDSEYSSFYWPGRKDDTATYFDGKPPKFDSTTQTVCSKQNLTLNDVVVNGYNIKWFDSLIGGNELSNATSLIEGQTYYAMNTAGSCESSRTSIKVTLQPISAPSGISPQNLCNINNPTLTNLNVSGTSIQWYNAASGGNSIPTTTPLINGISYYASQSSNGCESERILVIANLLNIVKPTTTSPQTFCIQQNTTLSSIAITGQNIKWYDALTNGSLLANTTLLQTNTTYYASQTINGCESERVPVLINIQNTATPTGNANQPFCTGQNPTIANIQITGNQIKWYDALNNGSLLTETTNLVNGKTYYASQTVNNCESERFGVTVSIVNTPLAPIATANQSFCKIQKATLDAILITGQNIKWYNSNLSTIALSNTTLLENNKTYYASQTIGCESDRIPVLIQVYNTALPTANNDQQFCIDENAIISNLTIIGSNIKWYDELTNGTIIAETTLLQNGKTYYATQTLNNCESERLAITVKIQDTSIPIANSPQIFCIQKNTLISDIEITGQNIKWFENASSSINLSESTPLENGITYYASQTISDCESDRIPIAITILEAASADCINLVDEIPYPKFFTPNNDGYNDMWTIDFAYLKTNTEIKIFDRYGKLIKTLVTNNDSWNGTFNGAEVPATDYWFVVTRANGSEFKGHFSLKR